jgi:hypothetical protein
MGVVFAWGNRLVARGEMDAPARRRLA